MLFRGVIFGPICRPFFIAREPGNCFGNVPYPDAGSFTQLRER